ncbi:unnamed protein product [Nippostrongylus brasiliensis]|uniref:Glycine rich protein n=1 Tax=Nippostrongylus brasiliensis TaxID=27835 RepID=A0A0N4YIH0_NIPBR|nr:unnamed protein product [Nippostrongylus brasiliensis]
MSIRLACLFLLAVYAVEGRSEFEERKSFHDWLCRRRPSLSGCSTPYTMSRYREELLNTVKRGTTQSRSLATKTGLRRDSPYDDFDDIEDYEYYLWKKYKQRKAKARFLEEQQSGGDSVAAPQVQYHYHYDRSPRYYTSPSYYRQVNDHLNKGLRESKKLHTVIQSAFLLLWEPFFGYPSYGYSYPYYGRGYGGYGGYGGGYGGYGGGLFSMGFGRYLNIGTPIGGFGIGSGFGIGIG